MFSLWTPSLVPSNASAVSPGTSVGPGESGRSRSPSARPMPPLVGTGTTCDANPGGLAWGTGSAAADAWLNGQAVDPDVLARFANVPQIRRKSIILRCMQKPPDNLAAWLNACSRNHADSELERRLAGGASVQRAASPAPPVVGVPAVLAGHERAPGAGMAMPDTGSSAHGVATVAAPTSVVLPERSPPSLSHELFKHWPMNKSELISEVTSCLQPDTLGQVLSLWPTDQSAFAFAVMIAAPEDPEGREVALQQWLRRLSRLRDNSPASASVSVVSASSSACKLRVQIVTGGFPASLAAMVIGALQKILPKFHTNIAWEFAPVIIIVPEEPADLEVKEMCGRFGIAVHDTIKTFQDFANKLEDLWAQWNESSTKIITLTNIAPSLVGRRVLPKLQEADLHSRDIRWVWLMIMASQAMRSRLGDTGVADLLLAPEQADPQLDEALGHLWGARLAPRSGHALKPGLVVRSQVWSTPSNFSVMSVVEHPKDPALPIDGWTGPSAEQLEATARNGAPLPSVVAKLAVTKFFQERELTPHEVQVLQTFCMTHVSGEKRFPSRAWWLRVYGLEGTPTASALTETFQPCLGVMISTTGKAAPPGLLAAICQPCGRDRYCRPCEAFMDVLSAGYDMVWTTDMLLAFAAKCVNTWNGVSSSSQGSWERSGRYDRTHHCSAACPHAPQ